jgi:hypothetical protein
MSESVIATPLHIAQGELHTAIAENIHAFEPKPDGGLQLGIDSPVGFVELPQGLTVQSLTLEIQVQGGFFHSDLTAEVEHGSDDARLLKITSSRGIEFSGGLSEQQIERVVLFVVEQVEEQGGNEVW